MKNTALLILAAVLITGVGLAKNLDPGYEPDGLDELVAQKGLFKTTMIRTGANFSRYTKLYPKKVMLVIRDPGPQAEQPATGSLLGKRSGGGVMPEWQEIEQLKRTINDALVAELGQSSNLELVHADGPGTLVLRSAVTEIVCDESSKNKTADGDPVLMLSQGTIVFDLIDGETGLIQARMGERRKCRSPKGQKPPPGAWPNVAHWAETAAEDFCSELIRLKDGTPSGS